MRLIWRDGRLAWPLVLAIAYAAAALVVVDYFWRMVVMPFTMFALYAVMIAIVPPILLAAGRSTLRRNSRRPSK